MKELPLSQKSKVCAIVDDITYEWLYWYKWFAIKASNSIYARRMVIRETDGIDKTIYLHKIICGMPSSYRVSFINGNSLDCRKENLRSTSQYGKIVTWEMSCGASHFNGVIWDGRYGMWRSCLDGMIIGYYITEVDAALAYNKKAEKFLPETINNLDFLDAP